jgi:predicted enzyme related to lactoylglutathione lyase
MKSAVVIKVNDLQLCARFYEDVLQLGVPEVISSFGNYYRTGEDSGVYLVKTNAKFLEHGSSAASWCFTTPDMDALESRLKKAGCPLLLENFHLGCDECRRGIDPEGNQFFVMEEK